MTSNTFDRDITIYADQINKLKELLELDDIPARELEAPLFDNSEREQSRELLNKYLKHNNLGE